MFSGYAYIIIDPAQHIAKMVSKGISRVCTISASNRLKNKEYVLEIMIIKNKGSSRER
jgi:hypothetical protein